VRGNVWFASLNGPGSQFGRALHVAINMEDIVVPNHTVDL
jgi:hypothetical protein